MDGFFDAGMILYAFQGIDADRERGDKPEKRLFNWNGECCVGKNDCIRLWGEEQGLALNE
ncbi:hypothetical protein N7476_001101 [Penicillium atrosanguineum]|uniref:Uncharacterized protein n=1 Tax=Penicillium atrosanguineum TaxID=1132637 RepID=A0A9W9QFI0_9EURO|nr:hypothetical protein N7476_001101 [Penicillium atrosanguineum]